MKQPTDPAPRIAIRGASATAAIGRNTLVGQPQALGWSAGLPEDVDRHPAARIPVAADPQPPRLHLVHQPLSDSYGHVLMKTAVVPERAKEQLQAFALDDRLGGRIVDHQMGEVRLSGHRAERRELRRREPHHVQGARPRVGHIVQYGLFGRCGQGAGLSEVTRLHRPRPSRRGFTSLSIRGWTRLSRRIGSPAILAMSWWWTPAGTCPPRAATPARNI